MERATNPLPSMDAAFLLQQHAQEGALTVDAFSRQLLTAMYSFREGNFAVRLPPDLTGVEEVLVALMRVGCMRRGGLCSPTFPFSPVGHGFSCPQKSSIHRKSPYHTFPKIRQVRRVIAAPSGRRLWLASHGDCKRLSLHCAGPLPRCHHRQPRTELERDYNHPPAIPRM